MNRPHCRKIAFISTVADTQWHFLRGQNRFLAEQGFQVHAIAAPGTTLQRLQERDGVQTHAVPMSRSIQPLRDLLALLKIWRILRRIRPDLVHVSTPKAGLLGAIAAFVARVPARVFLVRGLSFDGAQGWRRKGLAFLERLTAALCHRTLFVSQSAMELAVAEGMTRFQKASVPAAGMSNGIDIRRFDPRNVMPVRFPGQAGANGIAGPVIGFTGRLARDKGIDQLAAAWRSIRESLPAARLLLVGGWDDERPVDPAIRRALEQDPRVHVTGPVAEVAAYYRAMSVFVFPSRRGEGFPNAPMEAAAMELPVVATAVTGNVDAVIDGVTGTLVSYGDPIRLADAVQRYLNSPELCRRHGRAARQRVLREFRQERVWNAMLDEFDTLLSERGRPATGSVPALALLGKAA